LRHAIAVGQAGGAELTILHVFLLPLPSVENDFPVDWMPAEPSLREEIYERLRVFSKPATDAGLKTRLVLVEGNPADEILTAARDHRIDLIVMGSHGRRGFQRFVLGSHAERVLRMAPCPVLTIAGPKGPRAREPQGAVALREIVCAVSGSRHAPETVKYAEWLAAGARANLTLLHVHEHPEKPATDPWGAGPNLEMVRAERRTAEGCPYIEILRCARQRKADLIVIGSHDRGRVAFGCLGSTTDQVLREAECAVLTVGAATSSSPTGTTPGHFEFAEEVGHERKG
jgi:nucleotide-binding universal stress UspA family protein